MAEPEDPCYTLAGKQELYVESTWLRNLARERQNPATVPKVGGHFITSPVLFVGVGCIGPSFYVSCLYP